MRVALIGPEFDIGLCAFAALAGAARARANPSQRHAMIVTPVQADGIALALADF
jgi:hypothetical protein